MISEIFARHSNVALSLSGGKDSLACLYLMRPYWDRLTVYWCNTGDAFPETIKFMNGIRKMVPNFREISGQQPAVIAADGWPSDVVTYRDTSFGHSVHGDTGVKMQSRYDCCARSMMLPLYNAMRAEGVTCIIRGKRHDEDDKSGVLSGHVDENGIELQFPIYDWTEQDVLHYLRVIGVELPKFYAHGNNSIDCMHCTAYWQDGHAKYLHAEHPDVYAEWKRRTILIRRAVDDRLATMEV